MDAGVKDREAALHNKKQQQQRIDLVATPPPPHRPPSKYSSSDFVKEPVEYHAKYRIYERDFLRRINHKYFSGKKIAGTARVFETITTVDGFTIKESSDPPINRFLDCPSCNREDQQHLQSGAPLPAAKKPRRKS